MDNGVKVYLAGNAEILKYLQGHPTATRQEVAEAIDGITEDGVKYNIGRLQQYKVLKRVNGRKKGHWEMIGDYN